MSGSRLTVVRAGLPLPAAAPDEQVVSDGEVRAWLTRGRILGRVRHYDDVRLITERLATSGRPMIAWALRLAARNRCYIVDADGRERDIDLPLLLRWSLRSLGESVGRRRALHAIEADVEALARAAAGRSTPRWNRSATPLYLRTDLSFGVRAGGSVGHIAGVVNELARVLAPPLVLTTAPVPTLGPEIEVRYIPASDAFWNFRELPALVLNEIVRDDAMRAAQGRALSIVYQRYSLHNFAGLRLAMDLGVPFVLEYNGSEVWMSRHWGRPLRYERLADRIERLITQRADLVVVVSRAMRDELVDRGVAADRILVNPNAVDPERYRPDIDGSAIRDSLGLSGKIVVGLISTFQIWHGAEPLARAFVDLLSRRPERRRDVRLLMIGTGNRLAATRQIVEAAGFADAVVFTGLVEQSDGPRYLAACDLLVSPHVPNPDGTPFFGSPTKLFEYMAMGRGIVASDLDQIGDVLRDQVTALLVRPGDSGELAAAIERLIDDADLARRLGAAARHEVLAHHTWRAHVQRTVDAIASRAGVPRE